MKPGLQLRTAQGLTLTPQLQQSIRLLQLSTLELQQELQQALASNPFLELADEADDGTSLTAGDSAGHEAQDAPEQDDFDDGSASSVADTATLLAEDAIPGSAGPQEDDGSALWQHGQDSGSDSADPHADSPALEPPDPEREQDGRYPLPGPSGDDDSDWLERMPATASLSEHLQQQAAGLRLAPQEHAALQCLIASLDERGWLADPLDAIADSLLGQLAADPADAMTQREELQHLLHMALCLLQAMDPAGVGARDLAECLRLQLTGTAALAQHSAAPAALALLGQPLDLLARRDVRTLARLSGYPADAVKAALSLIASLEPQPARRFARTERDLVVPDVLVQPVPARSGAPTWQVALHADALPQLQVQERYARLLREHGGENSEALQQQVQEARWLVRSVQQRQSTLLRVSEAIVARQARFLAEGPLAMQPLVMRDIADALALHESTISRVCNGKFLSTPWGIFELKRFFGSALASGDGSATSSTAVRTLISQWIAEEPASKPLSDNRLCELLQERDIQCARRTVAKYREQLRIAPAHLRKRLD